MYMCIYIYTHTQTHVSIRMYVNLLYVPLSAREYTIMEYLEQ